MLRCRLLSSFMLNLVMSLCSIYSHVFFIFKFSFCLSFFLALLVLFIFSFFLGCVYCFVFIKPMLGNRYGPVVIPWGQCCFVFYSVCCFVFVDPILGNLMVRGHSLGQGTWGYRILTLHLNYVAGYTGPLLFLFERTHNYSVDNQGLLPWRLCRLGRSKVRSDSSVRCVPGSNR